MTRIALSGTGFIARGLALALASQPRFTLTSVLTRRPPAAVDFPFPACLSNDRDHCLSQADLLVECSGDVLHATDVIDAALRRGLPVVTMNAEFHVTVGSAFVGRGYLTEAEGDQPGCLAAFAARLRSSGFEPLVYGNIKGYLHPNPGREQMQFWAAKQGISLDQVTAFTDGSKVQIEQALVANGLDAGILKPGLSGPTTDDLNRAALTLASSAERQGKGAISDYVLQAGGPPGVFIVARHDPAQQPWLHYLKLGAGPHYVLLQPFHLCHLELLRTLDQVVAGAPPLLDNGRRPRVGVVAVAKHALAAGSRIERALGSFDFRGEASDFADHQDYVPIGLLQHCRLTAPLAAGERVRWQQVELPDSLALRLFHTLLNGVRD